MKILLGNYVLLENYIENTNYNLKKRQGQKYSIDIDRVYLSFG